MGNDCPEFSHAKNNNIITTQHVPPRVNAGTANNIVYSRIQVWVHQNK